MAVAEQDCAVRDMASMYIKRLLFGNYITFLSLSCGAGVEYCGGGGSGGGGGGNGNCGAAGCPAGTCCSRHGL